MTKNKIEEKVKKIIAKQLGLNIKNINNNAYFVDDLGADSLDTVELIMAIEEEFNIEISDTEAETIITVKKAIEFIKEKIIN